MLVDDPADQGAVADVALVEDPVPHERLRPGQQRVEDDRHVSGRLEGLGRGRADVAGAAGDQDLHRASVAKPRHRLRHPKPMRAVTRRFRTGKGILNTETMELVRPRRLIVNKLGEGARGAFRGASLGESHTCTPWDAIAPDRVSGHIQVTPVTAARRRRVGLAPAHAAAHRARAGRRLGHRHGVRRRLRPQPRRPATHREVTQSAALVAVPLVLAWLGVIALRGGYDRGVFGAGADEYKTGGRLQPADRGAARASAATSPSSSSPAASSSSPS